MNTNIPTASILKAAAIIKKIAYGIAAIGTLASYGTQVALLLGYEVGTFSYIIPATIDMLAICAAMALQLTGLDIVSRKISGAVLMVAVIVSIGANIYGAHNAIAAIAHAWPVAAYLLAELIANRVRAYADRLIAAEAAKNAPVAVVAPVAVPVIATPAVASPLPRATRKTTAAPTTRRTSHAACTHAATSKDRAVCRAGN